MMTRIALRSVVLMLAGLAVVQITATDVQGKKQTLSLPVPKKGDRAKGEYDYRLSASDSIEFQSVKEKIKFSGYDKNGSSDRESFFITNDSQEDIGGLEIEIVYSTVDGRMLHKRIENVSLKQTIKPGETLKYDMKSFDAQKSFHFIKSKPSRSGTTPYNIKMRIITIMTRTANTER